MVTSPPSARHRLPVELVDGRWFLLATASNGEPLRLLLDTAGGMFLTAAAVRRLDLPTHLEPGTPDLTVCPFPDLTDAGIPRPHQPTMAVLPDEREDDGMLGAPWFDRRSWVFDYAAETLECVDRIPTDAADHRIPVFFRARHPYGRITATVDDEEIDLLLDTGATAQVPTSTGQPPGGVHPRSTSFITRTWFDRWRRRHRRWTILEHADRGAGGQPAILVEDLVVAGHHCEPVWFTCRPDPNFRTWMAQWTDRPVDGALGGNAFTRLRLAISWPAATMTLTSPVTPVPDIG